MIAKTPAVPNTIGRDGSSATKMNPVVKVPNRAPAVPRADTMPTMRPVSSVDRSSTFTTSGVTVDHITAGSRNPAAARMTISTAPPAWRPGPSHEMSGMPASAPSAPASSTGPISRRASYLSAARPPSQAPNEIPARIVPMMPVKVDNVTPTYGARRRPAKISSTRTAADETKTTDRPVTALNGQP